MNNEQLAELFTTAVNSFNQPLPLDYRDRAVDLATYFNETIEDVKNSEYIIQEVRWAMVQAYAKRFNLYLPSVEEAEEENGSNTVSEEVSRN